MRDADRIREQSASRSQSIGTVVVTLAAVTGLACVFGMGYTLGRRVQRMAPCSPAASGVAGNVVDRLDEERQSLDALTFYDSLTADHLHDQSPSKGVDPAPPRPASKFATVAPAKKPSVGAKDGVPSAPLPRKGEFTLQVSSFRTRDEAQAFAAAMVRQGLHPYVVPASLPGRGTWYRVRVGRYGSEQEAKAAKGTLAQSDIPAWVLRID